MPTPTLFFNEVQDESLCHVYENDAYQLRWFFKPFQQIDDTTRANTMQDRYNQRGFGWAIAKLATQSVRWEGPATVLPANYRVPVLDKDGAPVIDKKTGQRKTKLHPLAGKQTQPTADLIQDMPDEVVAGAYRFLTEAYGARDVAAQEDFRESDPPGDASEDQDIGGSEPDRPARKRQSRRESGPDSATRDAPVPAG